jgi:uncharacterized protein (DUF169 family)
MLDYRVIEQRLAEAIGFQRRPVAIAFHECAPASVPRYSGIEPSGCSFWRLAAEGRTFYTVQSDHYNCPIGSFTHSIPLPPERASELDQTLSFMTEVGYIKMEEVPRFQRLARSPTAVIYSPLGDAPVAPDVVIFSGRPGRVMLLQEAALRAGIRVQLPLFGRPTCEALAASVADGVVASSGCVGNRVYTGIGDDELYIAIPGRDLPRIAEEAETIVAANAKLFAYHRGRRASLASE